MNEPRLKKSNCSYCGDAEINHSGAFLAGCLSSVMEPISSSAGRRGMRFFGRLADKLPEIIFSFLSFIKIVRFSNDINKAASHRSRVVWEEANRRNIKMEQAIIGNRPLEFHRARVNGRWFYFQSLPIPPHFLNESDRWDDKILLKRALAEAGVPIPRFAGFSIFSKINAEKIFSQLGPSLVVKPRDGSRGRHTTTNIQTPEDLIIAINRAKKISPCLAVEECLAGDVCRATVINGVLAGLYRASPPSVVGDGSKKISELIDEKNARRHERIEPVVISEETREHIARAGYSPNDVLRKGLKLYLTHRIGRFYGGETEEMIDKLHPSFIPILEGATRVLNISVAGFDCIIPDPTKDAVSQRWGIIECNTLPFIDLHYFALKGRPRNIAGMIWDLWKIEK